MFDRDFCLIDCYFYVLDFCTVAIRVYFFYNSACFTYLFSSIPMMEEHNQHSEHGSEHKSAHSGMPEIPKVDMKNVNADSLKGGFGDIIKILKLDKAAMEKVAHRDAEGISLALVYLAVGAIAAPLGGALLGYTYFGVTVRTPIVSALIGAVLAVVMGAVVYYVTSLVAEKMFHGTGKFPQYFRVMGYASLLQVVGLLTVVPILSTVAAIWLLVINYMALTVVHKLNSTNAVLTIIVTVVVFIALTAVIAGLGLTAAVGMGAGASSFALGR